MQTINGVTADGKQKQRITLPDGSSFTINMEYKPQQYGWFITQLSYGDFVVNNMRLCTSPNLLHQFRHLLPFGLAVYVKTNREATQIQDFSTGAAQMFLLNASETLLYENFLNGTVTI